LVRRVDSRAGIAWPRKRRVELKFLKIVKRVARGR